MAYSAQQIADAIAASQAQGFSTADILKGAQEKYGVGIDQIVNAMQTVHPDLYASTDSIMGNVNAGNYAANENDPKYQNLHNLEQSLYAATPAVDLKNQMFQAGGGVTTQPVKEGPVAGQPTNVSGGAAPAAGYGYFGATNNPYLQGMADNIGRQSNLALNDAFNQIRSNSVGNGTLGGAREGVAQGVAIGRAQDSLQGNLASLYGGAFDSQMNRGLQQYGIDQNAALGWGGLANQRYGIDTNAYLTNQGQQLGFYNTQRQLDQSGAQLGANMYLAGMQGPWNAINNATGAYQPFTGYGTASNTTQQGGGMQGAVGGALGTYGLGSKAGWW